MAGGPRPVRAQALLADDGIAGSRTRWWFADIRECPFAGSTRSVSKLLANGLQPPAVRSLLRSCRLYARYQADHRVKVPGNASQNDSDAANCGRDGPFRPVLFAQYRGGFRRASSPPPE